MLVGHQSGIYPEEMNELVVSSGGESGLERKNRCRDSVICSISKLVGGKIWPGEGRKVRIESSGSGSCLRGVSPSSSTYLICDLE